jgi:hypothetical protein
VRLPSEHDIEQGINKMAHARKEGHEKDSGSVKENGETASFQTCWEKISFFAKAIKENKTPWQAGPA